MKTKICSKCKKELPVSEFFADKQLKSGLKSHCKQCDYKIKRKPRAKKPYETIREVQNKSKRKYLQHLRDTSPEYREMKRKSDKAYRQSPAGKITMLKYKAKRRAKGGKHKLSHSQWEVTFNAFGKACAYCGNADDLTVDHFHPLNLGGDTILGNVIPACRSCNSSKQDRLPKDWCTEDQLNRILGILDSLIKSPG